MTHPHWNPALMWIASALALVAAFLVLAYLLRKGRLNPYIDRVLDGTDGPPTVIGGGSHQ